MARPLHGRFTEIPGFGSVGFGLGWSVSLGYYAFFPVCFFLLFRPRIGQLWLGAGSIFEPLRSTNHLIVYDMIYRTFFFSPSRIDIQCQKQDWLACMNNVILTLYSVPLLVR